MVGTAPVCASGTSAAGACAGGAIGAAVGVAAGAGCGAAVGSGAVAGSGGAVFVWAVGAGVCVSGSTGFCRLGFLLFFPMARADAKVIIASASSGALISTEIVMLLMVGVLLLNFIFY
ncbi:hypothetical protein [Thermincola ferriacetica]